MDPPPILELKITDRETGALIEDDGAILAMHCTLISPTTGDDESRFDNSHPEVAATQKLMGTAVASPFHGKDEHSHRGAFFVFPDLSCRSPGAFRLHFRLMRVDPQLMVVGGKALTVAQTDSARFNVYTAKEFPGMRPSSALLKALRKGGLNVGVKKGREGTKQRSRRVVEASESEEDSDDEGEEEEEDHGRQHPQVSERVPAVGKGKGKAKRKRSR